PLRGPRRPPHPGRLRRARRPGRPAPAQRRGGSPGSPGLGARRRAVEPVGAGARAPWAKAQPVRRTAFLVAIAALALVAAPSGALAARLPGTTCHCDGVRALAFRNPPIRGADVLDAQLLLRYLGLMRAKATGTYGRHTTVSVRRFQRLHRL